MSIEGQAPATAAEPGLYASSTLDEKASEVIVKVVNSAPTSRIAEIALNGVQRLGTGGKKTVLQAEDLKAENSLDQPENVSPVTSGVAVRTGVHA